MIAFAVSLLVCPDWIMTFWAAAVVTPRGASFRYVRWRWAFLPAGISAVVVVCIGIIAGNGSPHNSRRLSSGRAPSIHSPVVPRSGSRYCNDTGEAPWLGHGLTAGDITLDEGGRGQACGPSPQSPLQGIGHAPECLCAALSDRGIGAVCRITVILFSLAGFLRYYRDSNMPPSSIVSSSLAIAIW